MIWAIQMSSRTIRKARRGLAGLFTRALGIRGSQLDLVSSTGFTAAPPTRDAFPIGVRRDAFPVPRLVAALFLVDWRSYAMTVLPLSKILHHRWTCFCQLASWLCGLRWITSLGVLWYAGIVPVVRARTFVPLLLACTQGKT